MALSYARDIKPLFTAMDQDHMLRFNGQFDLWSYDDVKSNADDILDQVSRGKMPPPNSGEPPWTVDKVNTFKQWIAEGYPQ